jgi:hypothetical protein
MGISMQQRNLEREIKTPHTEEDNTYIRGCMRVLPGPDPLEESGSPSTTGEKPKIEEKE